MLNPMQISFDPELHDSVVDAIERTFPRRQLFSLAMLEELFSCDRDTVERHAQVVGAKSVTTPGGKRYPKQEVMKLITY